MFSARTGVVWSSGMSSTGMEGSTVGCGEERPSTGVGGSDVPSSDLLGVATVSGLACSSPASG